MSGQIPRRTYTMDEIVAARKELARRKRVEPPKFTQSHLVRNYYSIDVMQNTKDGLFYAVVTNVLEGDKQYLYGHGYAEVQGAIDFAKSLKFDFEGDWEDLKHKTDVQAEDAEANRKEFLAWAKSKGFDIQD